MVQVNDNYRKLPQNYLFSEVARRVRSYREANPYADIISLGIGDVTRPLCNSVIEAMSAAVAEMGRAETFRGYAPDRGYDFLIEAIRTNDYLSRGIRVDSDEIFVNDGAKSALGHFCDILGGNNKVGICDPVYPVYIDTNVMDGRGGVLTSDGKWSDIVYIDSPAENGFIPQIPLQVPDIIYICSPNNPTGTALNGSQLKAWVDYAAEHGSLILFDAAYEAFVRTPGVPRSIYEIEGARNVAVEFRSFSKTAGFTGVRCGYTVVPKELKGRDSEGEVSLNALWNRHQSTKFNGTAYIVQRAAEAVYSPQGKKETALTVDYYMRNADTIRKGLEFAGFTVYGGVDAPYIWLKTPCGLSSWEFFDRLLDECRVVGTPGVGFGPSGEGYFRLTAFGDYDNVCRAVERIKEWKI